MGALVAAQEGARAGTGGGVTGSRNMRTQVTEKQTGSV